MEANAEAVSNTTSGGVTVIGSDAPSAYKLAPRSENLNRSPGSENPNPSPGSGNPNPFRPVGEQPPGKKRGRPRKYGPDGTVVALSPRPISAAAPSSVIDFSAAKRGKVKPASSLSKTKFAFESLGEWAPPSVGSNFTPHIITVNTGEDITMKVISFSQQGPRAICILSANGVISSVTLRQPDSSGGTLTYEGRFEILSLTGSFMPSDSGGTRSRSGGMSVSLASPDGRVVGGGVAGLLVAAGPVQVVVGSFLAVNQHSPKPKKHRFDFTSTPVSAALVPVSGAENPIGSFSAPVVHRGSWPPLSSDPRNNRSTENNSHDNSNEDNININSNNSINTNNIPLAG